MATRIISVNQKILPEIRTSQKHHPNVKNNVAPSNRTMSGECGIDAQYPPAAAQRITPKEAIA